MTPKERREKLFNGEKPYIRPLQESDMKWLYGAYKYPDPPGGEEEFETFTQKAVDNLARYQLLFIAEDRNAKFKDKRGPVALIAALYNGWNVEPEIQWFPWATKFNQVRVQIAFMMFCRYNSEFGCTEIRTIEGQKNFFKKLKKYCPIYYVNKIPGGAPGGDVHLFYVRGKKSGKDLWAA